MEERVSSKTEAKRRKEEQKRLKQEEKERRRQEKESQRQLERESADALTREREENSMSRDNVPNMATHLESTMERDRQNRLSRISERSSKKSNRRSNSNRGSGQGFNYMAPEDDYAVPVKSNRGSTHSGGGSNNIDKSNRANQLARENSFRSQRSGHSGIGSVSMYNTSQVGTMNVGYHEDRSDTNVNPRIDEELASLRSGGSGLVKARASQWESGSQISSPRR